MKAPKKKVEISEPEDDTLLLEKNLEAFAELVAEHQQEAIKAELDPFELYSHKIHSSFHSNMDLFKSRFVKGYKILTEQLKELEETERDPKKFKL